VRMAFRLVPLSKTSLLTNEADSRIGLVDPLPRTGVTASLR
jgi:hypothetical protein